MRSRPCSYSLNLVCGIYRVYMGYRVHMDPSYILSGCLDAQRTAKCQESQATLVDEPVIRICEPGTVSR